MTKQSYQISLIRSIAAVAAAGVLSLNAHAQCNINMSSTQQTIDGFGFSSAWCGTLSSAKNSSAYGTLGFSLLRIQIDPNGNWNEEIANAAAAHAGGAKVLGSSWSAPGSWTTTGNAYDGHLQTSHYADYANWLKSAVSSHNLDWVSPANEPDLGWMAWTTNELISWIGQYGGSLGKPLLAPESCWFADSFGDPILNDSASGRNVSIYGGHLYGASPSVHQNALNKGKHCWVTEKYFDGSETDMGTCVSFAQEVSDCLNDQMSAYIYWTGLIGDDGSIYKNGYTLGQFAKWIRPGSTRVSSDYNPQSGVSVTAYKVSGGTVIVALNANTYSVSQQFAIQNGNAATMQGYRTSSSQSMADIGAFTVTSGSFTANLPAQSITTFVQTRSIVTTGATFYRDYNYGGTGVTLAAGNYTMSQLASAGVANDWASSVKIPAGWTVIVYANDNFGGTSWTLTSDTSNFGSLSPSANDQMSSCKVLAPPPTTCKLISLNSGKAMDASGGATDNGTQIIQWTYGGGANQQWILNNLGNNLYSIIGVASGKCVDINGAATTNGTKVQLWNYTGAANQKFYFNATTNKGCFEISPSHASGSCLDVSGISTSDGAVVQLWQWLGGKNQEWLIQPVDGTCKLTSQNSGKVMEVDGAQTTNGTQVIQWSYSGGDNQKWTLTDTGSGNYKIIGVASGKCVDIYGGGKTNGTKVQLFNYSGSANQLYKFSATAPGWFRITPNNATNFCLDVNGASTADGALVQLWQWTGGSNQQWAVQAP